MRLLLNSNIKSRFYQIIGNNFAEKKDRLGEWKTKDKKVSDLNSKHRKKTLSARALEDSSAQPTSTNNKAAKPYKVKRT